VIRVLQPKEIQALLAAIADLRYKTLVMLAVFSGARQGEIIGLKWPDVDFDNSQIHIQRTYNNHGWYKPKSDASNRRVDLGPAMMKQLKLWRLACPPNDLDLVFPNNAGHVIDDVSFLKQTFFPALARAGIDRIRFHDLRHTFASLLIEQGENIKYIQTQLGHASPSITLDVYSHLMRPSNPESAKNLENRVLGERHKQPSI